MSEWSFAEHVSYALKEDRMGDSKAPTMWPSSATAIRENDYGEQEVVGKCRRRSYFRHLMDLHDYAPDKYSDVAELVAHLRKLKIPIPLKNQWIFEYGNLFEGMMVNLAKRTGTYIAREVPVYYKEHNVSGRIDLIAINPSTGKNVLVELKSLYGIGADFTIGKWLKSGFRAGSPKESHIMQLALYHNRMAHGDEDYDRSQLIYGDRGTGYRGAYEVWLDEDKQILYRHITPVVNQPKESGIFLESIFEQYEYVKKSIEERQIPERDYDLQYSMDKINTLYERDELNKSDTTRHKKWLKLQSGERTRKINPVDKGDWQCSYCPFKDVCYDSDGEPKEL